MSAPTPRAALNDGRITFAEKDLPLRRDVGWLGQLLGKLLQELGDESLFPTVETARKLARKRRRGDETADERLGAILGDLEPDEGFELVRAFSAYFGLVNMAERVHRIRRRTERMRAHEPQPGGLRDVFLQLRDAGVSADEVEDAIRSVSVEPVMTAHPTEAVRRTLLRKEQRIARLLMERFHLETLTPDQQTGVEEKVELEIASGWQTEEQLHVKPTVGDEVEHVLFYLSEVIYRIVPALHAELERAFEGAFGRSIRLDAPLARFASWVGGDMDGNPAVGATTIRATLNRHLQIVIERYRREITDLFGHLSQSSSRVIASEGVHALVACYREQFPEAFTNMPERYEDMPYRQALQGIHAKLGATSDEAEHRYRSPDEFVADLEVLAASLDEHRGQKAGLRLVERLLVRVGTFGFHLAHLDCRQDAEVHRRVIGELLGDAKFSERSREERTERLRKALEEHTLEDDGGAEPSDEALRTLEVFDALRAARERHGSEAVGTFVISMAQGPDDALAILALARAGGCVDENDRVPLDVVPLFETVDDLERGPAVLAALAADPIYAEHLAQREGKQLVMLGYSDSNKDGGITASRWALQKSQAAMVEAAEGTEMRVSFFHGRGGSASRGGSKPRAAFMAAPKGAIAGRARTTEQGEVIHDKFGLRGNAIRTLELILGATIERMATGDAPPEPDPLWVSAMELMSATSRAKYRAFVHDDPDFPELFQSMTPIDVIERLRIGSRPAKRRAMRGVGDLRAIPWVFAWTQARVIFPGWFGVGTGLAAIRDRHGIETLRAMNLGWPFFDTFMSDVEMVLAKADMNIAARYARLAGSVGERMFPIILEEFDRTRSLILEIRSGQELLDDDQVLQRSIRLRNPYVDPMSLIQVDCLAKWRASGREDAALERLLVETVRGIARGLRNTG
ncbi:Phosphoenolpyruvate carboxylase [Planctomycetes bacterium Poly30]|uniref:Phosphoenolpyruvate carboxylase n=1 Tax=Saltatorellus ferox TaxID=2528018 RepID=A0A518ENN9_9BACT|nr:Phosphoenolpyruvate carboxylase [Planctomycetes bacterium Poly30]